MNTPQNSPPDEKSPLHWVLCSENWEDLMIIAVPELYTTLIENNYLDVFTQGIQRSYSDGPHTHHSTHQSSNSTLRTDRSIYPEALPGHQSH